MSAFDNLRTLMNPPQDGVEDGDTIEIDGEYARIAGFDTPEVHHGHVEGGQRAIAYQAGGHTATEYLRSILPDTTFHDQGERDHYGRPIVRGQYGDVPLSEHMIREGVAFPLRGDFSNDAERHAHMQSVVRRANPNTRTEWDERMDAERAAHRPVQDFSVYHNRFLRPESTTSRAWDRGVANLKASIGAGQIFLGEQFDSDWLRAAGEDRMSRGLVQAALNPADIETHEDVDGLADAGTYIWEKIVENAPNLALMAGGGLAGAGAAAARAGVAKAALKRAGSEAGAAALKARTGLWAAGGAGATIYPVHMGEGVMELMESDVDLGTARSPYLTAAVNTLLDVGPMAAILQYSFKGLNRALARDLVEGAADSVAQRGLWHSTLQVAKEAGKGTALGAPIEGVTEFTQTLINQAARAYYDPNYDMYSPEAQFERTEAFIAGAAVGGALGGAGRGGATAIGEAGEWMRGDPAAQPEQAEQPEQAAQPEQAEQPEQLELTPPGEVDVGQPDLDLVPPEGDPNQMGLDLPDPPEGGAPVDPDSGRGSTDVPPYSNAERAEIYRRNALHRAGTRDLLERARVLGEAGRVVELEAELASIERDMADRKQSGPASRRAAPTTVPEPATDVEAQLAALVDGTVRARYFAELSDAQRASMADQGLMTRASKDGGFYVYKRGNRSAASSVSHAERRATAQGRDDARSRLLGYQQTKPQAVAAGAPTVVQGRDADGNVVHEEVVDGTDETIVAAAAETAEQRGAETVAQRTPEEVLRDRGMSEDDMSELAMRLRHEHRRRTFLEQEEALTESDRDSTAGVDREAVVGEDLSSEDLLYQLHSSPSARHLELDMNPTAQNRAEMSERRLVDVRQQLLTQTRVLAEALQYSTDTLQPVTERLSTPALDDPSIRVELELGPQQTRDEEATIGFLRQLTNAFKMGVLGGQAGRMTFRSMHVPTQDGGSRQTRIHAPALMEAGRHLVNTRDNTNRQRLSTPAQRADALNAAILWMLEHGFTLEFPKSDTVRAVEKVDRKAKDAPPVTPADRQEAVVDEAFRHGEGRVGELTQALVEALEGTSYATERLTPADGRLPAVTYMEALSGTPLREHRTTFWAERELGIAELEAELDAATAEQAALEAELEERLDDVPPEVAEEIEAGMAERFSQAQNRIYAAQQALEAYVRDGFERPLADGGISESSREGTYEPLDPTEAGFTQAADALSGGEMRRDTTSEQRERSTTWLGGTKSDRFSTAEAETAAIHGARTGQSNPSAPEVWGGAQGHIGTSDWLGGMADAVKLALTAAGLDGAAVHVADRAGLEALGRSFATSDPKNAAIIRRTLADDPPGRILFLRDRNNPRFTRPVIYMSENLPVTRRAGVLMHEVGHLVMYHQLRAIPKGVEGDLKQLLGVDPHVFGENYANLFAAWVLEPGVTRDQILESLAPRGKKRQVLKRHLDAMTKALRAAWQALRKHFGDTMPAFNDFMNAWTNVVRGKAGRPETELGQRLQRLLKEKHGQNAPAFSVFLPHTKALPDYLNYTPAADSRVRAVMNNATGAARTAGNVLSGVYNHQIRAEDSFLRSLKSRAATFLADHTHRQPRGRTTVHGATIKHEVLGVEGEFFKQMEDIKKEMPAWRIWHLLPGTKKPEPSAKLQQATDELLAGNPQSELALQASRLMKDIYQWLRAKGVNIREVENYWPRVYDVTRLLQDRAGFIQEVQNWAATAEAKEWWKRTHKEELTRDRAEAFADQVHRALTSQDAAIEAVNEGPTDAVDLSIISPGLAAGKERKLPQHLVDRLDNYRNRDMIGTMHQYVRAAVRRGVWQDRFGAPELREISRLFDRKQGKAAGKLLNETTKKYAKHGVNIYDPSARLLYMLREDLQAGKLDVSDYEHIMDKTIPGYQGVLGADKTPPAWRRTQALMIVYQSVRILSMAVFTQFTDPGMMAARLPRGARGEFFRTGLRAMYSSKAREELYRDAKMINLIQDDVTAHIMNDTSAAMMASQNLHRVHEGFFKANGMQFMTHVWRAAALRSGVHLIQQWAAEGNTEALADLGITAQDVKHWQNDGAPMQWRDEHSAVVGALHQFAGEGILRPDAQTRPHWGNDHRYQVLWHLNSFTWQYATVILGRVWNESVKKWGENEGPRRALAMLPMLALAAWTLPLAALGMEMRWLIAPPKTGAPEGWDYFWETVQRSGLTGIGQKLVDMGEAEAHGQISILALGGPTVSHLSEFMLKDLDTVLPKSVPAYPLVGAIGRAIGGGE